MGLLRFRFKRERFGPHGWRAYLRIGDLLIMFQRTKDAA